MNTISKTRLHIIVAAFLAVFAASQIANADTLWVRDDGTATLEPNEPNDNVNTGSGNITTTGTITGGNVTASTITGGNFGYISCADIAAMGTITVGQNISATGGGAIAFGYSDGEYIIASGTGSLAGGNDDLGDKIEASGAGSFAMGSMGMGGGTILAKGPGSMAFGASQRTIEANAPGAIAMGSTDNADIRAMGTGSIAMGFAYDQSIEALGDGSVAMGNGVVAGPSEYTFAFGKGFTNNTAQSFAVGFGQADFEVWSGNARVNGDLEVTGAVKGTIGEEKEVFFEADYADNLGDLRTRNVGGTSLFRFTFRVPSDFVSLVSLKLQGYISAGAAQNNRDIDLDSDYGGAGEAYNNHSESDPNSTYNLSTYSGKLYEFDISGLFNSPGITAGDTCGLKASHNNLGGVIDYTGIVLKYKNY